MAHGGARGRLSGFDVWGPLGRVTLNTRSIQYAVEFIHDHGGGRLVFDVGDMSRGQFISDRMWDWN